jgi:outer membrane protein OmpA-like peptidoglycan-associated protein
LLSAILILSRRKGIVLAITLMLSTAASAEGLNRVVGPTSQLDTLYTQSPVVLDHLYTNVLFGFDYSHDPVVFRDEAFVKRVSAVEHQFTGRVAASLGLLDRLQLDVNLPASLALGQGVNLDGVPAVGLQDSLVGARVRLDNSDGPYAAALGLSSTLPSKFMASNGTPVLGERFPTLTPNLMLSITDGDVIATVNTGFLIRAPRQVADLTMGHMLLASASVQAELFRDDSSVLWGQAEVGGGFSNNHLQSSRDMLPLEASLGLYGARGPVFGSISLGTGLSPDVGTPDVRAVGSVGFEFDFAPANPATVPTEEAPDNSETAVVPEAPANAGEPCPDTGERVHEGKLLLGPIHFFFDSARIRPESMAALEDATKLLLDHHEVRLVSVEGHTSSEGTYMYNIGLSESRVMAVIKFLVERGVDPARLTGVAYGESAPVATNATRAGREKNRRVEFIVLEVGEATK